MSTILLVEDNESLAASVSEYLAMEGYTVDVESNGAVAEKRILAESPDLVILDLMLPGKNGVAICRDVRPKYSGYILMFTAKEDEVDQIVGLEIGADDYLIKPVRPRLLLAKVRAFLRRDLPTDEALQNEFVERRFGHLVVDINRRLVTLDTEPVSLTSMEFDLLDLLTEHPGQTLSRDVITQRLKGREHDGLERSADTVVAQLRRKLRDSGREPTRIKTIRGKGYVFIPTTW